MPTLQSNFHSLLRSIYGFMIFTQVRRLEKERCRIARYRNHRIFNLRCKKYSVLPRDLMLRVPVPTSRAQRLIIRTGRALLNERIAHICGVINKSTDLISKLESNLRSTLAPQDFVRVVSISKESADKVFFKFRSRQRSKFERMIQCTEKTNGNHRKVSRCFVTNLAGVSFSDTELSVLGKGTKFNIVPRSLPVVDIVASVEQGLYGLPPKTADVLRARVAGLVFRAKLPAPNLSYGELRALRCLKEKERTSLMFLPSDKGGGLVALSKGDYDAKIQTLLSDRSTYIVAPLTPKHPKNVVFDGVVSLLQELVKDHGLSKEEYKKLYPQTKVLPAFYGLPKTHKEGVPLRPIVACINTATYELSRFITKIIAPLVGQSPHYVKDSVTFLDSLKDITLENDEVLVSNDVTALFTSVPVDAAVDAVRESLSNDATLGQRTTVSVNCICKALVFCLQKNFFTYQGVIYKQVFGAAMGSPVSTVVANLFMESFEEKALRTFPHEIRIWKRYVDDACSGLKRTLVDSFLSHLNSVDPHIQFTSETESDSGEFHYLDLKIFHHQDGSLSTSVYRKPTFLGQYLHFDSHHAYCVKVGVARALLRRASLFCQDEDDLYLEIDRIMDDLTANGYPSDLILSLARPYLHYPRSDEDVRDKGNNFKKSITVPYIQGLSEGIRRILKPAGIRVCFKSSNHLRNLLCHPKTPLPCLEKSNVVYEIACKDCDARYVVETGRQLKIRVRDHRSALRNDHSEKSAVAEHCIDYDLDAHWDGVKILDTCSGYWERRHKEGIRAFLCPDSLNRCDTKAVHPAWHGALRRHAPL